MTIGNLVVVLSLMGSSVWGATKDCNSQLALTEPQIEQQVSHVVQLIRKNLAYNRDNQYFSSNGPKAGEVEGKILELESEIPDVRQRISSHLNNKVKVEANKSNSKLEDENILFKKLFQYQHTPIKDGPSLENEDWQSDVQKFPKLKIHKGVVTYFKGDFSYPIQMPKIEHKYDKYTPKSKRSTRQVLYYGNGFFLEMANTIGPIQLLKFDDRNPGKAHVVGELDISNFSDNKGSTEHLRMLRGGSASSFLVFDSQAWKITSWHWQPNGQFKFMKKVAWKGTNMDWLSDYNSKIAGLSLARTVLTNDKQLISKIGEKLILWDLNGKSSDVAKPIMLDDRTNLLKIISVDKNHFIGIYAFGQVVLWRIEGSADKTQLKLVSSMGDRPLDSQENSDIEIGHLANLGAQRKIMASTLVSPDHLLTAGADGRLILWRFDFAGNHEIVESFPNKLTEVVHSSQITKFRFKFENDLLLIESISAKGRHGSGQVFWQPHDLEEFKGEL